MTEILIETLIAVTSISICLILYRSAQRFKIMNHSGTKLVLAGFSILSLGFFIEFTNHYETIKTLENIIVDTTFGQFICSLLGFLLLAFGFERLLPIILEAKISKDSLSKLNNKLESLVNLRTIELQEANQQLKIEIEQREKTQLQLDHQRRQDALTQLPNRYALLEYLRHEKKRNQGLEQQKYHAIFLIDIDNFKAINDSLGHSFGDKVLIAVAKRLAFNYRSQDFLCRLSGNQFLLVLPDLPGDLQDIELNSYNTATTMLDIISAPLKVDGQHLKLSAGIGISVFYYDSMLKAEDLLRQADIAVYDAKDKGKGLFSFFQPEMQKKAQKRLGQAFELHQAIQNKELFLHYQPQVDNSKNIIGFEALLRWKHPTLGIVSPDEFIALAEEIGVIDQLGRYILHLTCQQCCNIYNRNDPDRKIKVAINISPSHFLQPDFVTQISEIIVNYDLSKIQLVLEITEEEIISDIEDITQKMTELRKLDINFSLDDFGTGYSSLTYLKQLPIDTVKIDKSFINDLSENSDDASIVSAILIMTNALKIDVIAEGIERESQFEFLKQHQCQFYQGYFFGKPQSIDDLIASGEFSYRTKNKFKPIS
ncbi:MAG: GGDEF domain-containing protein [Gammaproteobacteria bacterium]|nr:GGDEF domain-containing protein [Gammaproteobacteria bacterium]